MTPEVRSLGHISDNGARSEICGNVVANNYFRGKASVFSRNWFQIAGHAYCSPGSRKRDLHTVYRIIVIASCPLQ